MFKQPIGKQEKGRGETEEEGVGMGGGVSTSYIRVTLQLARRFHREKIVPLLLRYTFRAGTTGGTLVFPLWNLGNFRALLWKLQRVGDAPMDDHGRPLSKPAG